MCVHVCSLDKQKAKSNIQADSEEKQEVLSEPTELHGTASKSEDVDFSTSARKSFSTTVSAFSGATAAIEPDKIEIPPSIPTMTMGDSTSEGEYGLHGLKHLKRAL